MCSQVILLLRLCFFYELTIKTSYPNSLNWFADRFIVDNTESEGNITEQNQKEPERRMHCRDLKSLVYI